MFWNRHVNNPAYLFLLRYKEDQGSQGGSDGQASGEWQGKMRALKNQIYEVQDNLGKRVIKVEDKMLRIQQEVGKVKDEVRDQVENLMQSVTRIENTIQKISKKIGSKKK